MSARLAACVAVVLGLSFMGGCTAHEGQKVVGYSGGKSNNWVKARDPGRYSLRSVGGQNVTYYVEKGERIGFRKTSVGTVEAFAGDNAPVELDRSAAKQAYWKFAQKDTKKETK
jgi:hypothetical protein